MKSRIIASAWPMLTGALNADGMAPDDDGLAAEVELKALKAWNQLAHKYGFDPGDQRLVAQYFGHVVKVCVTGGDGTMDSMHVLADLLTPKGPRQSHGSKIVPLMASAGDSGTILDDPRTLKRFFPRTAALLLSNGNH